MQLCFEDCTTQLTQEELSARDIMVNAFNPVLKFFLSQSNPEEWVRYGCNSCRQTAIFGAVYLQELLPNYEVTPYEGVFSELINGKFEEYVHGFIMASKGKRHLVIDISRTSKKLLFNVVQDIRYPYPQTDDYKFVRYQYSYPIDLRVNFYQSEFGEYFTGMRPKALMNAIKCMVDTLDPDTMKNLRDVMYGKYTTLARKTDRR